MSSEFVDEAEEIAIAETGDAEEKMCSAEPTQDSNPKKPRRRCAEAFAKDNRAFPPLILWKVAEDIEYDQ